MEKKKRPTRKTLRLARKNGLCQRRKGTNSRKYTYPTKGKKTTNPICRREVFKAVSRAHNGKGTRKSLQKKNDKKSQLQTDYLGNIQVKTKMVDLGVPTKRARGSPQRGGHKAIVRGNKVRIESWRAAHSYNERERSLRRVKSKQIWDGGHLENM